MNVYSETPGKGVILFSLDGNNLGNLCIFVVRFMGVPFGVFN